MRNRLTMFPSVPAPLVMEREDHNETVLVGIENVTLYIPVVDEQKEPVAKQLIDGAQVDNVIVKKKFHPLKQAKAFKNGVKIIFALGDFRRRQPRTGDELECVPMIARLFFQLVQEL